MTLHAHFDYNMSVFLNRDLPFLQRILLRKIDFRSGRVIVRFSGFYINITGY